MEPVYSTSATASGGRRDGRVRSATLDLAIDPPGHGSATNPEELFAAGYATCFANAAIVVARKLKLDPAGLEVEAEVTLGRFEDATFGLAVELRMTAPPLTDAEARTVMEAAHERCPYSRATRGNVEVGLVARGGAPRGRSTCSSRSPITACSSSSASRRASSARPADPRSATAPAPAAS
jgi:Ohr subfamily peroxiredoxin